MRRGRLPGGPAQSGSRGGVRDDRDDNLGVVDVDREQPQGSDETLCVGLAHSRADRAAGQDCHQFAPQMRAGDLPTLLRPW